MIPTPRRCVRWKILRLEELTIRWWRFKSGKDVGRIAEWSRGGVLHRAELTNRDYSHDHCLICADVEGIEYGNGFESTAQLKLVPKMTISGEFDAGKTPKLIVTASNRNAKWLQTAGNRALILLACDGDRFSLYPKRAASSCPVTMRRFAQ